MTAIKYMHHVPGRLRLKGHHFNCRGEAARRAVELLEGLPGIERVSLNPRAGSLTVQYDPVARSPAELLALLDSAGCLQAATLRAAGAQRPSSEGVASLFGKALVGALAQRTALRLMGALL